MTNQQNSSNSGFTLIEVLIALVIISVGLIGLAALQARALQFNQGSYLRSQANVLAYDIIDRMRINRRQAQVGAYDIAITASAPTGPSLAERDLAGWLELLAGALPAGDGEVSCNATLCRIRVTWQEPDGETYEFSYQTRI
ncbi:type IV pilus modification protein PilV [Stutzerimonas stutzeri]|uniref:type IV pilus modification protein PilV n=1 Tax=Stutzerimonas stutzeri TaxID=316 RepID=UPI00147A24C5|nr:type IV pilus modification protein PilV [Stutzerimonas stutzeri]MDH0500299.1 type IV pilus modification protein PilV [Stutzerimonas stutzeri]WGG17617.1 type IV pilus modification protein PilV [Stutzerimonas stutzeri]WRQ03905.1 type IV pilus modification protein PilV [Stutzerimonas stutzeri]